MDLNQHSFIRTAFDDQTILISKAKFETAVHIHQTNTGTMLHTQPLNTAILLFQKTR